MSDLLLNIFESLVLAIAITQPGLSVGTKKKFPY